MQFDPREFFAASAPEIAAAPNAAARKRLIDNLERDNSVLYARYSAGQRVSDGVKHFVHASGRFPLTAFGRLNTYSLFAEHFTWIAGPSGRAGAIVPTGIATDSFNQHFFRSLVKRASLVSLYDFENSRPLFGGVHRSFKFCLLTIAGRSERIPQAEFAFFQLHPDDLARECSCFELTPDEIRLLNPNAGTCLVFRSCRDAEITMDIYRRHPVLIDENLPRRDRALHRADPRRPGGHRGPAASWAGFAPRRPRPDGPVDGTDTPDDSPDDRAIVFN